MGEPSLRAAALAGLVSAGLLIAGPGVAPAFAQPSDSETSSQGSDSAGDGSDTAGSQPSKADADDSAEGDVGDVGETSESDPPTIRSDALEDAEDSGEFEVDNLVPADDEDRVVRPGRDGYQRQQIRGVGGQADEPGMGQNSDHATGSHQFDGHREQHDHRQR